MFTGTLPVGGPGDGEDLGRIQEELEKMLATIDVEAAGESPDARALDAISFGQ